MIEIASRRSFSKVVADQRVTTGEQAKTDRGWQGKRPAVGPAYVVGRAGGFGHDSNGHCWRSPHFLKGNQSCERHRPVAQGGFAP
jgi:hypothetical protein